MNSKSNFRRVKQMKRNRLLVTTDDVGGSMFGLKRLFGKSTRRVNELVFFEPLEGRQMMSQGASAVMSYDLQAWASSSSSIEGFTPAQISKAYGFDQIGFSGGGAADGSGQTIAIVDAFNDPNIAADLAVFDAQFSLPAASLSVVSQTGTAKLPTTDTGWASEIALDVEWAHAIAPGAKILLVEANSDSTSDLMVAVNYARHATGVSVVSMSWGGTESLNWAGGDESSNQTSYDSYFTTPTGHQNVTFVAAAGDSGLRSGLLWPASSPKVLSVGGTSLTTSDTTGTYSSESGWSGTSGGYSKVESEPTYQLSVQTTGERSGPDVSYNANPNTGFAIYDSLKDSSGFSGWQDIGGTSAGAPQWAALLAIADQGRALVGKSTLASVDDTLATLYSFYTAKDAAGNSLYSTYFDDIVTGSSTHQGRPGQLSSVKIGYDTITGLGSPKAAAIVDAFVGVTSKSDNNSDPAATTISPISATFTGTIAPSVIAGSQGVVKIILTNTSKTFFSGPVTVSLYASSDSATSTDDILLTTVSLANVRLQPSSGKVYKIRFDYPTDSLGSYYFIASVMPTNTAESPAVTASSVTTNINEPTIDLAATFVGGNTIAVAPGKNGIAKITVTNLGNIAAVGRLNLALYQSADGTYDNSDSLLNSISNKIVNIKAGKSITIKLKYALSTDAVPGSFDLIGAITSTTSPADANPVNDIFVVSTTA